jgi:ADP-heptose:LPS heptosyltransferase
MKILILRFSSIGDIVLTTPVVRCLKKQLNAEIHYFTKPAFAGILSSNPYISKVHTLPDKVLPFLPELKKEKFDYVIDLHNNFRTFLIKRYLNVPAFSFDKLNRQKYLLVNFRINRMPDTHIVDRYMDTVKKLGVINDNEGLDYFIPEKDIVSPELFPETHRKKYAAVVAGATFATKRLPDHKLAELCEKIDLPVIVVGGKTDTDAGNYLENYFIRKSPGKIFNSCGKFNLNQSASIVQQAEKVYTHDTGLMHIASAFKKDIVSIWGNTVPEFGMYPYQTNFTVIENKNLSCRPCSKLGYNNCPKGHFRCMEDLSFEKI